MRIELLLLFSFSLSIAAGQSCPKYGSAKDAKGKKLNILKNRNVRIDSTQTPEYLPLKNLINSKKRSDKNLWSEDAYVYTEGYMISHQEQGGESCNCNLATTKKKNGDVHIYLGLVKDAPKKDCIIVEITPAYKKRNPGYDTLLVVNRKVKVYGYLFYDLEHENAAFTTCKSCNNIWRKTCWEIHPVTNIEMADE